MHSSLFTLPMLEQSPVYKKIKDSKKLSEGEREEALENLVSLLDQDIDLGERGRDLSDFVYWADTEQGRRYWYNLYNKLYG